MLLDIERLPVHERSQKRLMPMDNGAVRSMGVPQAAHGTGGFRERREVGIEHRLEEPQLEEVLATRCEEHRHLASAIHIESAKAGELRRIRRVEHEGEIASHDGILEARLPTSSELLPCPLLSASALRRRYLGSLLG